LVFFRVGHAERHFTVLVHAMPPFATDVAVQRGLEYFFASWPELLEITRAAFCREEEKATREGRL
jgi:hypothetical protein